MVHFNKVFSEFCRRNNVVSEFVRFNPLYQNQEPFQDIYDIQFVRKTVGTDLKRFEDPFKKEFCSTARRKTRKLLKDERFSCVLEKGFGKVDAFIDIYEETMARTNASGFYYFEEDYFNRLKENFPEDILTTSVFFEDEIVAMGLYFSSGEAIHDHLNGTKDDFLTYSPAYLLKYTMMNWAHENDYSVIHYGGGISNDPEDSVLKFKKRFSKNTEFEFHIGRKVWNPSVYRELCLNKGVPGDNEFFPAYRAMDAQIQQKQA
ncbi:GNAT family N-acetyltransferase [Salinicoccus sp. CNSTN-B1]